MKLKQLHLLLADDDIDDCIFFKEALAELMLSTQLTAVHDGEQLMKQLNEEGWVLPDVLFLDINMPRKNGFECLAEIKLNDKFKLLPVIMFSTSFEQEVVNRLFRNGAQHFIRKPAEFLQFKKIIHSTLTLVFSESVSEPTRENFVITI